jgi:hypothetical protein
MDGGRGGETEINGSRRGERREDLLNATCMEDLQRCRIEVPWVVH